MLHFSEKLTMGEMFNNKNLKTPIEIIDFLIEEGLVSESKLKGFLDNFCREKLDYNDCVLLANLFDEVRPNPTTEFYNEYNLIRFLECKGLLNISAIKSFAVQYHIDFNKRFESEDK